MSAKESYPEGWIHGAVFFNPKNGEIHADGTQSIELRQALLAAIEQAEARGREQNEPLLGLATTRQLIDELAARAEIAEAAGSLWPRYTTASPLKRDGKERS